MDLGEFLRLVPIFKFDLRPKKEGYRHYIPLMDFIEVFETNRLYIVTEQELQMEFAKGCIETEMKLQSSEQSAINTINTNDEKANKDE